MEAHGWDIIAARLGQKRVRTGFFLKPAKEGISTKAKDKMAGAAPRATPTPSAPRAHSKRPAFRSLYKPFRGANPIPRARFEPGRPPALFRAPPFPPRAAGPGFEAVSKYIHLEVPWSQ